MYAGGFSFLIRQVEFPNVRDDRPSVVCSDVHTDENDNNVQQRNVYVLVANYTITK